MTGKAKQLRGTAVRDRLVDIAADLFYTKGIHAVGMDEVVRSSGGAKATLYRWFPTKESLVLAVLERRDDDFWNQWARTAAEHPDAPLEQLRAQIGWIQALATRPTYRGCAFVNTAAEFDTGITAIRDRCLAHETKLAECLLEITDELDVADSAGLAQQLHIAVVGGFALAGLYPDGGPAHQLTETTDHLIQTALAARRAPADPTVP